MPCDGQALRAELELRARFGDAGDGFATAGQGSHGRTNTREGGAKGTETRVPAWAAVRTTRWLYVAYRGHGSELYDLRRDPYETANIYGPGRPAQGVKDRLAAFRDCGNGPTQPVTCQQVARGRG